MHEMIHYLPATGNATLRFRFKKSVPLCSTPLAESNRAPSVGLGDTSTAIIGISHE